MSEKYSSRSPYNYALNNPLKYIDPTGMKVTETDSSHVITGDDIQTYISNLELLESGNSGNTFKDLQQSLGDAAKGSKPENAGNKIGNRLESIVAANSGGDPYRYAKHTYYGGMALGASFYLTDGPEVGLGDAAGAIYQTSTVVTAGLMFIGTYAWLQFTREKILNPNLGGTTTSRGNPTDWSFDPEINRLQNDKYYPPGSKPPGWFWPAIGAAGAYELYQNWPKPNIPLRTQPVENTYVAPARPIYPYGN